MLGDFIPDIDSFGFNQPTSDYLYVGLTYDTAATPTPWCATGYHIGVKLEEPTRLAESDSQFDSKSISSAHKCLTQAGGPVSSQITAVTGFPGTLYNTSPVYDRKVNY